MASSAPGGATTGEAVALQQAVITADAAARAARAARDEAIIAAEQGGVSMYRLAKDLRMSWQAIRKIVNAGAGG